MFVVLLRVSRKAYPCAADGVVDTETSELARSIADPRLAFLAADAAHESRGGQ